MTSKQTYVDAVRAYQEAYADHRAAFREWVVEKGVQIKTPEDEGAAFSRFCIETRDEVARIDKLVADAATLKAELEHRWIVAHEDLAVLCKAGLLQTS